MVSVAIVGTGISGLGVASLLHSRYAITVYEKSADIGGHTRTRTIRYGEKEFAVDTGFIVFNHRNYPLLTALFRHLGVPTQKSHMTFGVSINQGQLEWGAQNPNALFGQRRNFLRPAFWRFLTDILRFNRHALRYVKDHPALTLGELLEKLQLGPWFASYYLLPMGGAIWSCPLSTMLAFPAQSFVNFFEDHGLLTVSKQPQWHTVTGGSKEYMRRLIVPFADHIRTGCAVTSVTRSAGKVAVADNQGRVQFYDHVVFACHADQALMVLNDATAEESHALRAFKYQPNRAVLHKDPGFMPRRKRCWSSWVYLAESGRAAPAVSITYWMNKLQSLDPAYPIFVTLNPAHPIAPEDIFDEHVFDHPIYSMEAIAAQATIKRLQGRQNTWFCGAHLRNGFHEDGLASAVDVARQLGVEAPWR